MIAENTVASIQYTLKNDAGEILDQSSENNPLQFIHGKKNIIPGLEKELEGKKIGEKFTVRILPENAYGVTVPEMIQSVPIDQFKNIPNLQVGMSFQVNTTNGGTVIVRAVEVTDAHVVLDGNHPLAGVPLNFEVEVVGVRPATEEELMHGHLHMGAGCCGGGKDGGHCHDQTEEDCNDESSGGCCGGGGCC